MDRARLVGIPLADLGERYRDDLFGQHLPFWEAHGIDHNRGGFLCSLDHDGTPVDTDKRVVFQGRGLWVYSFLYNRFGVDRCLEIACKAYDFLLDHGRDDNGDWVHTLNQDGSVRYPADGLGFAGIFVAEGLQEYYRATGNRASMDLALESIRRFLEIYDDSSRDVPQWYLPRSFPGMRTLGYEEMTIRVLTQILEQIHHPKLDARVRQSVDAVVNRFWNPIYDLNDEMLTHDYQRIEGDGSDFVYLGHSIVTSWIMLCEAMRIRDRTLFDLVAERLKRHIEVAWDRDFGGLVRGMHVHRARTADRMLWTQDEALVGTMMLIEHTDLDWPRLWFDRIYRYVEEKFSLKQYGYPLWILGSDREVTFEPHVQRKGNYHHPRQLMLNLLAIEGMIGREGRVSNLWD